MHLLVFNSVIVVLICVCAVSAQCPSKCSCKGNVFQKDLLKMRCGDGEKVENIEELNLATVAYQLFQLNLSYNHLTSFVPKVELVALQKLDLSYNLLSSLPNNAFFELQNLKRLDLSGNNIKTIGKLSFINLEHLERLKLNRNQISTIEKGTFDPLRKLTHLDISNNPLTCDCQLLWLLETNIKLISNPICAQPSTFKGISLKKIKIGVDIHCKSPALNRDMPVIELVPNYNQIVFEGDSFNIRCRAPSLLNNFDNHDSKLQNDHISWSWADLNPVHYFEDVLVHNHHRESGLLDSMLSIDRINKNHSGQWTCHFISVHGNHTKAIEILVISDKTKYCQTVTTTNNKGSYTWPRTVVNYTVSLTCESVQLNSDLETASYFCNENGTWTNLNTSVCPYTSETTKILEQFSKVNLTLDSILESAKHFKNYTSDLKIFRDVMDFVYVVRTIENYLNYLKIQPELAPILLDVSNHLINLPKDFIHNASKSDNSSQKLVRSVETIANYLKPPQIVQRDNIALEEFPVKPDSFSGKTCTWYDINGEKVDRLFHCADSSRSALQTAQNRPIFASVQIPNSLFYQIADQESILKQSYKLLVAMYENNKLFYFDGEKEDVTTAVVGIKLEDMQGTNLTEPIFIMLKTPVSLSYDLTPPTPVWWDPTLKNGTGAWSSEGCEFRDELQDNIVFSCNQIGYYGILQNIEHLKTVEARAKFRFSHPAVYVGSFIMFICFLISILTYLLCYTNIQMPKKAKHSLINTWIAISLLCFIYVFGIYQTENVPVCQSVGIVLHYLSLSSLLWMCVGVNSMYKRLRKNDIIELQDDELPSEEPIHKPILGLYLVGWGIALIVCGISGALNMKEYSSHLHCFLSSGPALSTLFVPFTILIIILIIFFLLIRCSVYNTDHNGHLSEGTQATENVDLDLLEPNFPNPEINSARSVSSKTASSEVEDPEHAPLAQLKAYIIFLIIYLISWFSCAFATAQPFNTQMPLAEDIFSVSYAIFSSILGAFTLFFYCVARHDVRTQWIISIRWFKKKGFCFRSRNISDTIQNIPQINFPPPLPVPNIGSQNGDVVVTSRSSSRSSSRTKSHSHTSNIFKGAADFNTTNVTDSPDAKINNVNLLMLHRQQYFLPNLIENPMNSAEMFYNPHQSTVARKFFKKQKRNMMKRNNISTRPTDLNSDNNSVVSYPKPIKNQSSLDQKIFGTNSKVNNTNIHVETSKNYKKRNLNIFSDSCEDLDSIDNIPVGNLVKHVDRVKKREMPKIRSKKKDNVSSNQSSLHENNMRSVSQQCTLEYSSETISDSILDKNSPDKYSNQECFLTDVCEAPSSFRRENSPTATDIESTYCNQNTPTLHIRESYKQKPKEFKKSNLYEHSEASLSVVGTNSELNEQVPRIYVNPHDVFFNKRVQSRASSVSASELDELYQQIRRGPVEPKHSHSQRNVNNRNRVPSPYLSDSQINVCVGDFHKRVSKHSGNNGSDIETTV